jgi:hypothetical protein
LILQLVRAVELPGADRRRQEHTETRATTHSFAHLDPATVGQHDGLTDGQPKPMSGYRQLCCGAFAEEGFKYALAILNGDAGTFVVDGQLQFGIIRDARRDTDRRPWWRVLGRVLDQIAEHALHLTRVHPHCWQCLREVQPKGSTIK